MYDTAPCESAERLDFANARSACEDPKVYVDTPGPYTSKGLSYVVGTEQAKKVIRNV